VKGTIHWLSANDAVPIEVRVYGHLFADERPMDTEAGQDFIDRLNPDSLAVVRGAFGEPSLAHAKPPSAAATDAGCPFYQFERQGYFVRDPQNGEGGIPAFNKTIGLRDTWAKIQKTAGRTLPETR
jgi:glutaminyl-tRNA synthetase